MEKMMRNVRDKLKRYLRWVFLLTLPLFTFPPASAQVVVDKMIATVNSGGVRPSLITYSDLLWQLALQPDKSVENPSSENLNSVLNLIVSQRLILQEAEKLPTIAPTDEDIRKNLDELVKHFPSQT